MNRAARVATSEVRRHPRPAGRFGLYVGRHPKKILNAIQLARRAMKLTGALQEALTDPRAKAEATSAMASITTATRLVREAGLANALADEHIRRELRRASTHASRAIAFARHPKPRRSLAVPLVATVAATALTGAAYFGLNRYLGIHEASVEIRPDPASPTGSGAESTSGPTGRSSSVA